MSEVLTEGGQTLRKNSYASSSEAKLTLRVNGEEKGVVITPQLGVVQAGFDAPTVAPVASSGGAGSVPEGYYVYRYAYASSRYPFVANDVTAGGEQWPRSSPSPSSNTFQVTGGTKQVSVQVTYTTRSDVDYILVYRTIVQTSAADAEAQDDAGNLFYVGRLSNNTAGGTTTFTDNEVADTGEAMELDNYVCPLFYKTTFDGFYWWGFGNKTLEVVITLDGTTTFSIDTLQSDILEWFSGRDGYTINFAGITTGGYDGRGNYYFKVATPTTGQAFVGSDLVTPSTVPATGTTTAYLTSPATTLYRSKRLNPFSWGRTTVLNDGVQVPELWAERIGGGVGTAIGLIPNERILKLDTEGPQKSYALDLNAASNSDFLGTLRTLDEAQSTGSHFSQYPMRDKAGQTTLSSVNAKAYQILSADGQSQIPIGDPVIETLKRMRNDTSTPTFYHGVFDYRTELNCWWVKTTDSEFLCDTLIYQHSNTGLWGFKYTPGITASCTVFDGVTNQYHTFVGDSFGRIGDAFAKDVYTDLMIDESDRIGFWTNSNGEPGQVTLPLIGTATAVIDGDGNGSGLSSLNLETGGLYLSSLGNSGPTRIIVTNGASGTFITQEPISPGSYADTVIMNDFTTLPIVAVRQLVLDSPVPTEAYILTDWNSVQSIGESAGDAVASVADNTTFGINILTGDYQSVYDNTQPTYWDLYVGATACAWLRYFNGGNPERNKRNLEFHISQENVGDKNALRIYPDYGLTIPTGQESIFNMTLTQDPQSVTSTGSVDWFTTNTPSGVYHAIGLHMLDVGYEQYRAYDFTLKVQPS